PLSVTVVLPEHHDAQNQTVASYPDATKLSRQATITSARVDPEAPPAIFRPLRRTGPPAPRPKAPVAELVDALDSKSSSARSAGSIPARGTRLKTSTITITYSIGSISDFQEIFRGALKTRVKGRGSRPFCWHFCWYRGTKCSRRISLFRTREL